MRLPKVFMQAIIEAYDWGYMDRDKGLGHKSDEEITETINRGFLKGLKSRGLK